MQMTGEARLLAPRQRVWDALTDPVVLKASIPGCETLERSADDAFVATVVSKVGPIKARFTGKITLSNIVPPRSYTLSGEGGGGVAGFAKVDIEVSLDALESQITLLRYVVKASVGGKLAQLGSRMIDSAARKSADDFFVQFSRQVDMGSDANDDTSAAAAELVRIVSGTPSMEQASVTSPDLVAFAAASPLAPPSPMPDPVVQRANAVADISFDAAMTVLTSEQIKVWIADQIAVITLNRPRSRNAMTHAMWRAVPTILGALNRNPEVRAVILTGSATDFCAGADITEFDSVRGDPQQAKAYESAVDACCDAIASLSKPIIAVLRGYCLGGGVHLAMACDFRYAAADAVFGIPAARLSIIYGVRATRRLLSLVGLTQAKKILFGAQRFDASDAFRIGLVDHVTGRSAAPAALRWLQLWRRDRAQLPGDVMSEARAFARSLVENAPLSIAGAKDLLNSMAMCAGALDLARAEAQIDATSGSEDYSEGRAAFAAKRSPTFKGR